MTDEAQSCLALVAFQEIILDVIILVFSRQRLSRLTFLKVFCLQTPLSDLKMIGVFTSKIKFHLTVI